MSEAHVQTSRPVLLVLYQNPTRLPVRHPFFDSAWNEGFRVVVTTWSQLILEPRGLRLRRGLEIVQGKGGAVIRDRILSPEIILHRSRVPSHGRTLVHALHRRYPKLLCSCHPFWLRMGDKWFLEECLRETELAGRKIPRPPTWLATPVEIPRVFSKIARTLPLIFKPSTSSCCVGIQVSTPRTWPKISKALLTSVYPDYVVQHVVANPLLYEKRRIDFRLYALVTSFRPLWFTLLPEGVARIAALPSDAGRPGDLPALLTGCTYRKRNHLSSENLPATDMLNYLSTQGWDVRDFWHQVETVLREVFSAVAESSRFPLTDELDGWFYLTGVDFLAVADANKVSLLFLETNDLPDLAGWGRTVDRRLRPAYSACMKILRNTARFDRAKAPVSTGKKI